MKNNKIYGVLFIILVLVYLISLFKNISYPLMWADESMTAMGSERVVKFGYPKVHDGKNVLNDMFCSTPKKAVNEKHDAFIGGANWGQYYVGAIGYKLADSSNEIYSKTGIFRSVFAIAGFLGLMLFAWLMASFFNEKTARYTFLSAFFLAELVSVSMTLHLREVRYYSPALFFSLLTLAVYLMNRFVKPWNRWVFASTLTALLWILFNMFSPLYFVFITAIGISEVVSVICEYTLTKSIFRGIKNSIPASGALVISILFVYPLLSYFKTFEMKKMLDAFYHFDNKAYWWHFSVAMRYFYKYEIFWLMIVLKAGTLLNFKKLFTSGSRLFRISNFMLLLFAVFIFSIPNIDTPAFTRYLIYMQPVIVVMALFDFYMLFRLYSGNFVGIKNKSIAILVGISLILFGYTFTNNLPFIEGHIYEMSNQYKGPLDYIIPYIQSNYNHTDTLIIATNYEETSYMYYLNSKVIVGFVGNNLPEDTVYTPQLVSYRQSLGSFFPNVFNGFSRKAPYRMISFPGRDIPVNNIPELNFDMPQYNHYFRSVLTDTDSKAVHLFIKN